MVRLGVRRKKSSQVWVGCSRNEPLGILWEANGPGRQGGGKGIPKRFVDSLRRETSFSSPASALPHSWAHNTTLLDFIQLARLQGSGAQHVPKVTVSLNTFRCP